MKNTPNKPLTFIGSSLIAIAVFGCVQATPKAKVDSSKFNAAEEINWINPFEGAPIQFGVAHGETFNSAHGTFGKFPGNFITPEHVHSHSYHGIVISGRMTNPMKGDNNKAKEMAPGSYWSVPASSVHQTACISKEECVFFMHQDASFDFSPTDKNTMIDPLAQSSGVFTPAEKLNWINPFGEAPIQFAVAYGDTFNTPHGTFGRFQKNFITPEHRHDNAYHGIVISGTMTNPMSDDGLQPKQMGPGSHWYVAENAAHQTACISEKPCLFYMYQDTNFNFVPVAKSE